MGACGEPQEKKKTSETKRPGVTEKKKYVVEMREMVLILLRQ